MLLRVVCRPHSAALEELALSLMYSSEILAWAPALKRDSLLLTEILVRAVLGRRTFTSQCKFPCSHGWLGACPMFVWPAGLVPTLGLPRRPWSGEGLLPCPRGRQDSVR